MTLVLLTSCELVLVVADVRVTQHSIWINSHNLSRLPTRLFLYLFCILKKIFCSHKLFIKNVNIKHKVAQSRSFSSHRDLIKRTVCICFDDVQPSL